MFRHILIACCLVCANAAITKPTLPAKATESIAAPAAIIADQRLNLSFSQLGATTPMTLRGIDGSGYVGFGLRLDQVVTAAHLTLSYDYSPALLPNLSHLKVILNDEVVGVVPIPAQWHEGRHTAEVDIDPRYFSDYNRIRLQLIGHYTLDCEDPAHSSLWATVSNSSTLALTLKPLASANDLALLPAPFFDRHDNGRLVLPMVLATADLGLLQSTGEAASWFGALASYRGARFPLVLNAIPEHNALVLATQTLHPAFLDDWLAHHPINAPALAVIDAPGKPGVKLLLLLGRDQAQLKLAVDALVLGEPGLTGTLATVSNIHYGQPRALYDAPNWVPTDRPVRFGELVPSLDDLQAAGHINAPMRVNLRVPPDLFPWRGRGVPLDLRYRYTAPLSQDNSTLNVALNEEFVHSFRLQPSGQGGTTNHMTLPLLEDGSSMVREKLSIPAFRLGGDNQLQFEFRLDLHKKNSCENAALDNVRAGIDPDSTVDLSDFPHFTTLPNLAYFANSAYPFSRYADLSHTAVVVPDKLDRETAEAFLFIMGRMGRATGFPAVRYRLAAASKVDSVADADLVWLAQPGRDAMLEKWGEKLPALIEGAHRRLDTPYRFLNAFTNYGQTPAPSAQAASATTELEANGPIAAIVGFESPLKAGQSVVAISASSAAAFPLAEDALEDPSLIDEVRGHVALVRGRHVESYQTSAHYDVGSLPLWIRIWVVLSRHPLLLTLLGLGSGLLLGASAYAALRKVAQRRLQAQGD